MIHFKSLVAKRRFLGFWKKIWTFLSMTLGVELMKWFNETSLSKIFLKSNSLSFRPVQAMFQPEPSPECRQ